MRTLPLVEVQAKQLSVMYEVTAEVLVVDNDPRTSARAVVEGFRDANVRYVSEAVPGISAARNRAIDEAAKSDVLVFIDDDEVPDPKWLRVLFDTWHQHESTAVVGRVISQLPHELDAWAVAGRFFERPIRPTGMMMSTAATNNLLLDLRHIRDHGLRFDISLGLSGGEDNLFSRQLVKSGGTIVFTNDAVVIDVVPADRTTRRFLLSRAWSHGNTSAVVDLRLVDSAASRFALRSRLVSKGLMRVAFGTIRFGAGLLVGSQHHNARGLRTLFRGFGMVVGACGIVYQEYAREHDQETRQES